MSTSDDLTRALQERERAAKRLSSLRRAALFGDYDEAEFDAAIQAYRAAEAALRSSGGAGVTPPPAARAAAVARPVRAEHSVPVAFRTAMDAEPPFVPTERMRFVKWLVETGRLSDQR